MRIITSGCAYVDIDAYAGIVAYAELLNATGQPAQPVTTAPWNESITRSIRSWATPLRTTFEPSPEDTYTLIDVSQPEFFDSLVDRSRIDEIIDHHPGREDYWRQRIGGNAHIEFVGAACTLIFERWAATAVLNKMRPTTAKLLVAGILDNTLNFKAQVSTERDKTAFNALIEHAGLPNAWVSDYFNECQDAILRDISISVRNDSKKITFKSYPKAMAVGQIVVWRAEEVLTKHLSTIEQVLSQQSDVWFANVVSIDEGASYFFTKDHNIKLWLSNLLGVSFAGDVAQANRLWLRKEILLQDLRT